MSYLPKDELEPDKGGRKPPSMNRIAIWVIVVGVGVYFLGSGIYGILTK
ncbi:hypothetical protein [Cryobacterium levicorallinum]|uniref:Uncharacterized protein n=1 Tax=Cryobacterium levicorallinum TaxID=995038 RepID=A0ABY1EH22_9MICO|nr:hypothetical protein [Cryobacterium levicorallinum]GEP28172.1 hypothetical protein CLE01_27700 [Cryobacterium levicorallinum]SFH82191.1 hypothetical protein SAMN05216274_11663 [Cryobacterium levicorallinum]